RELVASGLSNTEARRAARLQFGSPAVLEDQCRDTRRVTLWEDLLKDTRYALWLLARSPAFALAAILSLALGIAANTAGFSLVDAVLLRSLPVERPEELVFLDVVGPRGRIGGPTYPAYDRISHQAKAFSATAAFATDELRVEVDGQPEQLFGQI